MSENEKPITQAEADKTNKQIKILTLVVVAVAAALILSYLSANVLAPANHYRSGVDAMQRGDFKEAIDSFSSAGAYKDAEDLLASCRIKYADFIAGKPGAISYVTSSMKWLSVSDSGEYGFKNDTYEDLSKVIPDYGIVIIPDVLDGILVTSIKEKTFMNADTMVSVTIPDKVKEIPDSCFYNCSSLREVVFGKETAVLSQRCFINCTGLTDMTLPETVSAIGLRAFNNCYGLTRMSITGPVAQLMPYTFSDCYNMKEIHLPATLHKISENAFLHCEALEKVYFAGSESEWNAMEILEGNESLTGAEIIFAK